MPSKVTGNLKKHYYPVITRHKEAVVASVCLMDSCEYSKSKAQLPGPKNLENKSPFFL